MHPRTDLRLLSPSRLSRKQLCPLEKRRRTRPVVRIPCFMGNPCLSFPPAIRKTYPFHSSPRLSTSTSAPMRFLEDTHFFLIFNIDKLLGPSGGVRDIQFHDGTGWLDTTHTIRQSPC